MPEPRFVHDTILVHRRLAAHGAWEFCDDCPCLHCGTHSSDGDGDHSCPCPNRDDECAEHPWARTAPSGESGASDA